MERHEIQIQPIETQRDDEQAALVVKAMVSAVAAMALIVVLTVVAFHSGTTIA